MPMKKVEREHICSLSTAVVSGQTHLLKDELAAPQPLLAAAPPDEFADLVGTILGKPQIAGLIQRDIPWITATHHVRTILRDVPSPRIDLAEHTGVGLSKPQVAIGTSGDLCRLTVEGQPRMLHDRPGGR